MYLDGRTSGTLGLGVGHEENGEIKEDSQVSSLN